MDPLHCEEAARLCSICRLRQRILVYGGMPEFIDIDLGMPITILKLTSPGKYRHRDPFVYHHQVTH